MVVLVGWLCCLRPQYSSSHTTTSNSNSMMLRMMNPYTNDGQKYNNYDEALASAHIADLARQVLSNSAKSHGSNTMRPLGRDFRGPGRYDVICARGKSALNHPGNITFREMIMDALDDYSAATSKLEKSNIVSIIVDSVRERSPYGGFVKKVNGEWFEVGYVHPTPPKMPGPGNL